MAKKEKDEIMSSSLSMVFTKVKMGAGRIVQQQVPLVSRSGASVNTSSKVSLLVI
jgi:hypothetical protein